MSDREFAFGLDPDVPANTSVTAPDPAPAAPRKRTPKPDPVAAAVADAEAKSSAKAAQDRALVAAAAELADLAERVARTPMPACPESVDAAPESTAVETVIGRWNSYAVPAGIAKLGLPVGSRLKAIPYGDTGVQVLVKLPAGAVAKRVGDDLAASAAAWKWGTYTVLVEGADRVSLTREIVGADPAAPWRAAGRTAYAIYAHQMIGNEFVSHQFFEAAGWVVKSGNDLLMPQILERVIGPRGPELLVDLPAGMSTSAAVASAEKVARLLRCPDLRIMPEGVHVRIELRTVAATQLPQMVPLWPASLYRPTTPEAAIKVGKRVAIPVGVTLRGDRLERIEIEPAKVPHGVLVGSPGSGKSRWVRGVMTAWTVSGGLLEIGDPKGGELVQEWLPGCVHISTSKATIFRMLLWAQVEMKRRLAVQAILQRRHGVSALPVQPVLVVIDEFGQMMTELEQSTDPADKLARSEVERVVTNAMQVGRSVGIHLLLITQNALASSLPGGIAQAASFRVSVGRPTEGASGSGSVGRLFPAAMRDRAAELGARIETGSRGMLLTDWRGEPVLARAFYGYTPGEEPDGPAAADLPAEIRDSWTQMRAALQHIPPTVRFGWRPGPDAPDDWPSLSLSAGPKGDQPTVATLLPVPLDRLDTATGRVVPIAENACYDPLSDAYEGGFDPIDLGGHFAPTSY